MQKSFIILSLIVTYCESASYGNTGSGSSMGSSGGYGSVGGFGSGSSGFSSGGSGYGNGGASYGGGGTGSFGNTGPVQAAIETHRTVEVRPVNIPSEPPQPQVIEVGSEDLPVTVHFKSQSSRIHVQQTHIPGVVGETEHTSSEDEPHRVVHEVVKPVIQEVREIIQPYRRLVQQIQPVIEQTHTIVAKGEPRQQLGGQQVQSLGGSGGSGGGYSMGGNVGGGGSYGGHSTSYSSRSGSLLPSSASAKDRTVAIESAGSSRIKYIDSSLIKNFRSGASSRARA